MRKYKQAKYNINEQFFEEWSNDMAYVLGVIASDGCLFKNKANGKSIRIGINIKDIEWLKSIRNLMGSNHPIYKRQKDNIALLCVGSKKLFDDIVNIGIKPRKSLDLDFPQIPKEYINHFIRGYVDGDGCIRINRKQIYCSISGTKKFLLKLKELFSNIYNKEVGNIRFAKRCYELTYGGNKSAVTFLNWIYYNSTPSNRLNRKFINYTNLNKLCSNNIMEIEAIPLKPKDLSILA